MNPDLFPGLYEGNQSNISQKEDRYVFKSDTVFSVERTSTYTLTGSDGQQVRNSSSAKYMKWFPKYNDCDRDSYKHNRDFGETFMNCSSGNAFEMRNHFNNLPATAFEQYDRNETPETSYFSNKNSYSQVNPASYQFGFNSNVNGPNDYGRINSRRSAWPVQDQPDSSNGSAVRDYNRPRRQSNRTGEEREMFLTSVKQYKERMLSKPWVNEQLKYEIINKFEKFFIAEKGDTDELWEIYEKQKIICNRMNFTFRAEYESTHRELDVGRVRNQTKNRKFSYKPKKYKKKNPTNTHTNGGKRVNWDIPDVDEKWWEQGDVDD